MFYGRLLLVWFGANGAAIFAEPVSARANLENFLRGASHHPISFAFFELTLLALSLLSLLLADRALDRLRPDPKLRWIVPPIAAIALVYMLARGFACVLSA